MLKIGMLGAGRIAHVHALAISAHPASELVAVADVVADAAHTLADGYGAQVIPAQDMFARTDIDAIIVASSTDTHSDFIEAAVTSGKAVFCEKPIDLNLERARTCEAVVKASGQPVMIGFNRRFDPNFGELKRAMTAGEIGKPELLTVKSFDPAPPPVSYIKVSGGLFRDMMIHDFDMCNFLMGELPATIMAHGSCLVDPEIGAAGDVDTAVVTMTYADGKMAAIHNSRRAAYGYDQRVELLGSGGLLQAGNMLESSVVKSTSRGVTGAKPTYFFLERYMSAFRVEWAGFVEAVTAGTEVPVTIADGIAALAMAEAATRSAQARRPVDLAEVLT